MKMMIRYISIAATAFLSAAAASGEMMYDPDDYAASGSFKAGGSGSYTLNYDGRLVLKLSISKGAQYTFVSKASEAAEEGVSLSVSYIYTDEDKDTCDADLSSSYPDDYTSCQERMQISLDDWVNAGLMKGEDYDPEVDTIYSASAYYLVCEGVPGTAFSINSMSGLVDEQIPSGYMANPIGLGAITTQGGARTAQITDVNDCWFSATMMAEERYSFTVSGQFSEVTAAAGTGVFVEPETLVVSNADDTITLYVMPATKGSHLIQVRGSNGESFNVAYRKDEARSIGEHELFAELKDGVPVTFPAGARNDSAEKYYDRIIDTSLFSVALKAGELAHFETGYMTSTNYILEVYNEAGVCVATNRVKSAMEAGNALSYTPAASGTYYVGACQDDLNLLTDSDAAPVTGEILYTNYGVVEAEADDQPVTGNALKFVLGDEGTEGALQLKGDGFSHAFDAVNSIDWYILGARKGIKYNLKATGGKGYVSSRPMNLSVYTLNAKGVPTLVTDGNLGDPEFGVSFTAPASRTYYVKASLPDGAGCDYPYDLYAWVDGSEYGFLQVNMKGAMTATWNLSTETAVKYNSGAEILLKAGDYEVQPGAATGWTAPAREKVTVVAGNENRKIVTLKYTDTFDPKDDVMGGATAISASYSKPVELSHSLWWSETPAKNDAQDFYKLAVKPSVVYDLSLTCSEGAATMNVYRDGKLVNGVFSGEVVDSGATVRLYGRESATYYVVVTRAEGFETVDTAYVLTARSANIGQIKTDKAAYTVGEKAGVVNIKLSRSGKEGKVRLRYTTKAGSAVPGKDYEAQSGIITWENGDGGAKTISIGIIPDLIDTWAEGRAFSVVFDAVDPEDYAEADEYYPMMVVDEVQVAITDSSKAAPGTIQFAETKLSVAAGEDAVLTLTRTGGSDQMVGVLATVAAKSVIGEFVDTEPVEIWWFDGDSEDKTLSILTMRPTDQYFSDQAFTVKLTAIPSAEAKAAVKNGTATVTVTDGSRTATVDGYAASYSKASGVTVKTGAKDTWFFDQAGALRSITPAAKGKVELTFTVTGPGRLAFSPEVVADDESYLVSCTIGKEIVDIKAETYVERYLGAGSTAVKLTLTQPSVALEECYLSLAPQQDGLPFLWEPLPAPALIAPLFGANQLQAPNNVHLAWTADEGENVRYRIFIDKNAKLLGSASAMISSLSEADASAMVYPYLQEGEYCPGCDGASFEENATYSWRVDSIMLDEAGEVRLVNTNKTVWTFKTTTAKAPIARIAAGTDAEGNDIAEAVMLGETIQLKQGVKAEIALGDAEERHGLSYALVSGAKLPDGLKLDAKTGVIGGVPTKIGTYNVAVAAKDGAVVGSALAFAIEVKSIGLAVGTYNGLLSCHTSEITDDPSMVNLSLGSFTFSSTTAGKLTAKVNIGGAAYTFTGTSWDEYVPASPVLKETVDTVTATLRNTVTINRVVYTNELTVTATAGSTNSWESVDRGMDVDLSVSIQTPDKSSVVEDVMYSGAAYLNVAKLPTVLARTQKFAGYYTMALAQVSSSDGAPEGTGYLTATVDAKGTVKYTGVLADGMTVSGSSALGYISGENGGGDAPEMVLVPVFFAKGTSSFGGWIQLNLADAATVAFEGRDVTGTGVVPVVESAEVFGWYNTAPVAWDGWNFVGFDELLQPVGGYYSKVANLQAYYNGFRLYLKDLEDNDQLPVALADQLGGDYEITAYAGKRFNAQSEAAEGLYLTTQVNAITAEKTTLINRVDAKGKKTSLIDWEASVNPCKFTFKFAQATGIFSGTLDVYAGIYGEDGVDVLQKKLGTFKHQGILLMTREVGAQIDDHEGVMTGFYQVPASFTDTDSGKKSTINLSYGLTIGAEVVEAVEEVLPRD